MPRRPHTRLFVDPRRTVVLSGPHIHVLDAHGLRSTIQQDRNASGPIRCAATTSDVRYLATVGDDKRLDVWDLESLALLSTRELPKKPTEVAFSRDSDVLVSDKFGDVFRYPFHPNPEPAKGKTPGTLASHENPSGGELVLGHASLVTTCLLTPDEKYIITADRDEHVRVSWYPEGYVIQSYCLGHTKYVSAVHIPSTSPTLLISGGGDVELKIWDWMTGRLQRDITIFPAVKPFIRVTAQNRRRERHDDEEPTGKEKRPKDSPVPEEEGSNADSDVVLVVRRISSFVSGGDTHVVFSAVGATAIFEFVLTDSPDRPDVRHHDFRKPVIDFTVCERGTVWVLLDADFFPDDSDDVPSRLVQAVQWSVDEFVDVGNLELLDTLDAVCSLPATVDELRALDLYSDLSSLPKSIDREQGSDALERSKMTHEPRDEERPAGESASGLTKRALGRLKHKRALDQLQSDRVDMPGPDEKKIKGDGDADT